MSAHRRPGRLALVGGIALSLGLAGIAAAWAHVPGLGPVNLEIRIHYSHFQTSTLTVPAGVAVTVVLRTTVTFSTAGTYLFICHLPGHEAYGMVGRIIVEGD